MLLPGLITLVSPAGQTIIQLDRLALGGWEGGRETERPSCKAGRASFSKPMTSLQSTAVCDCIWKLVEAAARAQQVRALVMGMSGWSRILQGPEGAKQKGWRERARVATSLSLCFTEPFLTKLQSALAFSARPPLFSSCPVSNHPPQSIKGLCPAPSGDDSTSLEGLLQLESQ